MGRKPKQEDYKPSEVEKTQAYSKRRSIILNRLMTLAFTYA